MIDQQLGGEELGINIWGKWIEILSYHEAISKSDGKDSGRTGHKANSIK